MMAVRWLVLVLVLSSCLSLQQRALQQQLRAQRPTAATSPLRVACAHDEVVMTWPEGIEPSRVQAILTGWSDADVSYWLLSPADNDNNDAGDAPRGVALLAESSMDRHHLVRVQGDNQVVRNLSMDEAPLSSLSWTPCPDGNGTDMCIAVVHVTAAEGMTNVMMLPETDFGAAPWGGIQLNIQQPSRIVADPTAPHFVADLAGQWWSEAGDVRDLQGGELLRRGPALLHTRYGDGDEHQLWLLDTLDPSAEQLLLSQPAALVDLHWTHAGPSWRDPVGTDPVSWTRHSYHCDG
jgi:hypothetical protein